MKKKFIFLTQLLNYKKQKLLLLHMRRNVQLKPSSIYLDLSSPSFIHLFYRNDESFQKEIKNLQMKLKFKDEIIEKQKNELTDVREIARFVNSRKKGKLVNLLDFSSQNKSLCEKMESYRKVYERLELELMKVNHQFQVLKELTRNKDFSVDVSQVNLLFSLLLFFI